MTNLECLVEVLKRNLLKKDEDYAPIGFDGCLGNAV